MEVMEIAPEIIVAAIAALFIVVIFLLNRGAKPDEKSPKAIPPEASPSPKSSKSPLDDRMEVDAPVVIHEGMTLAEIKKAKSAKIKGNKGRRETAMEATAKSKEDHSIAEEEVEEAPKVEKEDAESEIDDVWGEMLSEAEERSTVRLNPESLREDVKNDADNETAEEASTQEEGVELKDEGKEENTSPEKNIEENEDLTQQNSKAPKHNPRGLDIYSEAETSLEDGLKKTRTGFIKRLGEFFSGPELAGDLVEEIEEVLYTADIGPKAASHIMGVLEDQMAGERDPKKVWEFVREYIEGILKKRQQPLDVDSESPFVIMMIGVNGVGKTTTIGKLASKYQKEGKKVLLVAGDTFRAAAVEQLQVWGDRVNIPVHSGAYEADPSSVIFSGIEKAVSEKFDIVICDTAGRLHTKAPLLDELGKMGRVTKKVIKNAPHETILVLDANTGQNAIQQALVFNKAVPITGIVVTKLDGTAKGGVILGICEELDAPIRFIGIGEGVNDLRPFNAEEFAEALFL